MKKTAKILFDEVFPVSFGSLAKAQSASITANAIVISEIEVTSVANLIFSTLVVGQKKTIHRSGNVYFTQQFSSTNKAYNGWTFFDGAFLK